MAEIDRDAVRPGDTIRWSAADPSITAFSAGTVTYTTAEGAYVQIGQQTYRIRWERVEAHEPREYDVTDHAFIPDGKTVFCARDTYTAADHDPDAPEVTR